MPVRKKWIITVSNNRTIQDVKKHLADIGFNVNQVLDEIGCITGTASEEVAGQAREIPGVADVSPESPAIDIGRPGEPETW